MNESQRTGELLVMGAGAVGCCLGGHLQAAGMNLRFVGRPRVLDALRVHGLTLTDLDGARVRLHADALSLHAQIPAGCTPALVLLTVKSGATAAAAGLLGAALPAGTPVLSMQNGVSNVEVGRRAAPRLHWLAGMVPFNIVELAPGHFHRASSGALAAQDDPVLRAHQAAFERAGLPLRLHADLRALQWGKLLLNLNNPVNALSGLPLRAELMDRGYRGCLAALQLEALESLQRAGIVPARVAAVAPRHLPTLLRLPTPLFRLLAARLLRIDAKARSSMADDLAHGRATEIDALCGEIVRLAESQGRSAPVNARMLALVKGWPQRPEAMDSRSMKAALGL